VKGLFNEKKRDKQIQVGMYTFLILQFPTSYSFSQAMAYQYHHSNTSWYTNHALNLFIAPLTWLVQEEKLSSLFYHFLTFVSWLTLKMVTIMLVTINYLPFKFLVCLTWLVIQAYHHHWLSFFFNFLVSRS
jgi:hypothetical protein